MTITPKKPVNYLNNKDILKEIHASKNTYCTYLDKNSDHRYDFIVDMPHASIEESLKYASKPKIIKEAKETRAARLSVETGETVNPKKVPTSDLVFRVMTWDHIPIDEVKQKKADAKAQEEYDDEIPETEYDEPNLAVKGATKYTKVNFPPFQHYQVTEELTPVCVGKSHWKGGVEKGNFSKDHGSMTAKLAHMFIKLCERYATRSNWRGYTYNDEMRSQALLQLSQIGLQFDEAKSQNPFAYYTAAITNSFTRVLNIEKRNQNIRDDILEMNNFSPSYTRQGDWGAGGGHYEE